MVLPNICIGPGGGGKSHESINLVQKMKGGKNTHKKMPLKGKNIYRNIKHLLISFKSSKVLVELEGDPIFGWGSDLISRMRCEGFSLNSGDLELGVVFPNSESGLPFFWFPDAFLLLTGRFFFPESYFLFPRLFSVPVAFLVAGKHLPAKHFGFPQNNFPFPASFFGFPENERNLLFFAQYVET